MTRMVTDESHNPIRNERRDSPISNENLAEWLDLAVPLAMAELAILPDAEREARIRAWLADAVPALGAADALMFQAKRGTAERSATGLAKGVAAAAAIDGEVEVLGRRFVWPGTRPPAVAPEPTPPPHRRPAETVEIPGVSQLPPWDPGQEMDGRGVKAAFTPQGGIR